MFEYDAAYNPYESEKLQNAAGITMRPGGFELTKRAVEYCRFQEGAKLLDLGCGVGGTAEFLKNFYGFECTGIDKSSRLIEQGLRRNPSLDLRTSSCETNEMADNSFDGVLAECSLCLMQDKTAVLKEARRILKQHGYLIVSDLYQRNLKQSQAKGHNSNTDHTDKVYIDEIRADHQQAVQGIPNCPFDPSSGRKLRKLMESSGFEVKALEDHTRELKEFIAEMIMFYGSTQEFLKAFTGKCISKHQTAEGLKWRYFLCIAQKRTGF